MSDTDWELLARYTRHQAEDAFAEIVRCHLGLVHSAALRQVRSPQLAEEVAQSTFLKLARHARQLEPDTLLGAWLYQVTRREAIDVVRREARRQLREQIASEMNVMNATAADWTHIEPLLDEAMHALDEPTAPLCCCATSRTNPCAKSARLLARARTPRKSASPAPSSNCTNFSPNAALQPVPVPWRL
jgi:RNA polymerase sigma factor (sigma-70 family)